MSHTTVSEIARTLAAKYQTAVLPRHVSELFYSRRLDDEGAPIIAGRRMIDRALIPAIEIELRRAGKLPPVTRRVA